MPMYRFKLKAQAVFGQRTSKGKFRSYPLHCDVTRAFPFEVALIPAGDSENTCSH
jgi:hypothetical protein